MLTLLLPELILEEGSGSGIRGKAAAKEAVVVNEERKRMMKMA